MPKKLKVVFIDFDDLKNPLLSGGQARATYEVARRLVKLGHKVTIICSRFPGSYDRKSDGIFYRHIGLGTSNIKVNNIAFFVALPLALRNLSDDVIVECFTAPISTCFSPVFTSIPVIGMPTMFEAEEFSKKYHLPFHKIEKFGAGFYRYFLAYSSLNKIKMEKLNSKIYTRIIPNGVSEEAFSQKVKEGDYAFFIGRIDIVQKGLDLLVSAMTKVKTKNNFEIVIAGNGPKEEERKLLDLIKSKKLEGTVSFIGRVDGQKKTNLIANSMFGIYPSRFEDFPLVPLEFASHKKPLVCFDIKGLAWVPENVAIKAESFDVNSLAKAITQMVDNKKLRSNLSKNARPFARKYGWDSIAKEYENYFFDVLEMEQQSLEVVLA